MAAEICNEIMYNLKIINGVSAMKAGNGGNGGYGVA